MSPFSDAAIPRDRCLVEAGADNAAECDAR